MEGGGTPSPVPPSELGRAEWLVAGHGPDPETTPPHSLALCREPRPELEKEPREHIPPTPRSDLTALGSRVYGTASVSTSRRWPPAPLGIHPSSGG